MLRLITIVSLSQHAVIMLTRSHSYSIKLNRRSKLSAVSFLVRWSIFWSTWLHAINSLLWKSPVLLGGSNLVLNQTKLLKHLLLVCSLSLHCWLSGQLVIGHFCGCPLNYQKWQIHKLSKPSFTICRKLLSSKTLKSRILRFILKAIKLVVK